MRKVFSRQTPYDDDYGTCLETRATLRIYPGEMSPHEITNLLQLAPSKVNIIGETRVNKPGVSERSRSMDGSCRAKKRSSRLIRGATSTGCSSASRRSLRNWRSFKTPPD